MSLSLCSETEGKRIEKLHGLGRMREHEKKRIDFSVEKSITHKLHMGWSTRVNDTIQPRLIW
jgi:hypothetical protein